MLMEYAKFIFDAVDKGYWFTAVVYGAIPFGMFCGFCAWFADNVLGGRNG